VESGSGMHVESGGQSGVDGKGKNSGKDGIEVNLEESPQVETMKITSKT